jgi:hypothetical protein
MSPIQFSVLCVYILKRERERVDRNNGISGGKNGAKEHWVIVLLLVPS